MGTLSITTLDDLLARCGGELNGKEGPTRKISDDVLEELKNIFDVTGGTGSL